MSHPDLDTLLNALLPFAQEMLEKRGEFYPFGVTLKQDSTVALSEGYGGHDHPISDNVISLLEEGFRNQASVGQIRAAGICTDVSIVPPGRSEKTDAIRAAIEHMTGESIEVFLPYRKGLFGKIKYGDLFAAKRTSRIFDN